MIPSHMTKEGQSARWLNQQEVCLPAQVTITMTNSSFPKHGRAVVPDLSTEAWETIVPVFFGRIPESGQRIRSSHIGHIRLDLPKSDRVISVAPVSFKMVRCIF